MRKLLGGVLVLIAACGAEGPDDDLTVTEGDPKADGEDAQGNWAVHAKKTGAQLGQIIIPADLDGDGLDDLVIGAPGVDKAYVYLGRSGGPASQPDATFAHANFGWGGARVGDCVALTATENPYVSLYCGLDDEPVWTSDDLVGQPTPYNDWRIAGGDVNGDGFADLVITESDSEGRLWLVLGKSGGLKRSVAWRKQGEKEFGRLGDSLVVADFDGDGFADLAVGAPADAAGEADGYVRLYRGNPEGLDEEPGWTRRGPSADSHYGRALAAADVNGDGRPDLVIGYESSYRGRIDVYHAAGRSFSPGPEITLSEKDAPGVPGTITNFGTSLASAGDIDGDGDEELLVGESNYGRKGRAQLFRGGAAGLSGEAAWSMMGQQQGADFGEVLSAADIDGDGRPDVLLGEPLYDARSGGGTADSAGRVHAVYARGLDLP